jgi:hypothetical protein
MRTQEWHQTEQDFLFDSDTAGSWSEIRGRNVEKYGASGTGGHERGIVSNDDEQIVEAVVSPHGLGTGGIGERHEAIVIGVARVIDPPVCRS